MNKIIIGNWKMFKTKSDIEKFKIEFYNLLSNKNLKVNYGLAIPSIFLSYAKQLFYEDKKMLILAQDCHYKLEGPYTGNISWNQLKSIDIIGSLVGHSERRQMFGETDSSVNKKNKALLANDMISIVCVGETLQDYENNNSIEVVLKQVEFALMDVTKEEMKNILIAYEPIWAIGTGKVPTIEEVYLLIEEIRNLIKKLYSIEISCSLRILYGGSVKPNNINGFLSKDNISGALVGSASLNAVDFFSLLQEVDILNEK